MALLESSVNIPPRLCTVRLCGTNHNTAADVNFDFTWTLHGDVPTEHALLSLKRAAQTALGLPAPPTRIAVRLPGIGEAAPLASDRAVEDFVLAHDGEAAPVPVLTRDEDVPLPPGLSGIERRSAVAAAAPTEVDAFHSDEECEPAAAAAAAAAAASTLTPDPPAAVVPADDAAAPIAAPAAAADGVIAVAEAQPTRAKFVLDFELGVTKRGVAVNFGTSQGRTVAMRARRAATAGAEFVDFDFSYTQKEVEGLHARVRAVAARLLGDDAEVGAQYSHLFATSANGSITSLADDAAVRDLLDAAAAANKSVSVTISQTSESGLKKRTMSLHCTAPNVPAAGLKHAEASFDFVANQPALARALLGECCDALDLFPPTGIDVAELYLVDILLDGDWVAMTSDGVAATAFCALLDNHVDAVQIRVRAVPPKPSHHRARVQVIFHGRVVDVPFEYAPKAVGGIEELKRQCRARCGLDPLQPVTLLRAAVATELHTAVADDETLFNLLQAAVASLSGVLALRLELGVVEPDVQSRTLTLHIAATLEGADAAPVEFDFPLRLDEKYLVKRLDDEVQARLLLDPRRKYQLCMALESAAAPQPIVEDDQIVDTAMALADRSDCAAIVVMRPVAKAPVALAQGRATELNALCLEWRDVLADPAVIRADELGPVITTWQRNGRPMPSHDPLMARFREFESPIEVKSMPFGELQQTLYYWTQHLSDEELSSFCHHCRNTIDFLAGISTEARTRRALATAFRAHAIGGRVDKAFLEHSLTTSGAVAKDEVANALEGYDEALDEAEFGELMLYFFASDPRQIHQVFSAATVRRPRETGKAPQQREVDALRDARLRSDIRHALDGVTVHDLMAFAQIQAQKKWPGVGWEELAWSIAALLRHPVANDDDEAMRRKRRLAQEPPANPRKEAWRWFIDSCSDATTATQLLRALTTTGQSYAPLQQMAEVADHLLSPELEPSVLLVMSPVLASLSKWAVLLAQATCHTNRWLWPPLVAPTEPPGESPLPSARAPMRPSPPRSNRIASASPRAQLQLTGGASPIPADDKGALVAASPPASPRFEPKYGRIGVDALHLTRQRPDVSLADLLAEQREAMQRAGVTAQGSPARGAGQHATASGSGTATATASAAAADAPIYPSYAVVTVASITELPDVHGDGSVDAYVVAIDAASGDELHRTPTVEGSRSPRFAPDTARFLVPLPGPDRHVVLRVCDDRAKGAVLGEAVLKGSEGYYAKQPHTTVLRLKAPAEGAAHDAHAAGSIAVEVAPMRPLEAPPADGAGCYVRVRVDSAQNVNTGHPSRSDVYVQVLDAHEVPLKRTPISTTLRNPEWPAAQSSILVPLARATPHLTFALIDDDLRGGAKLGAMTVSVNSALAQPFVIESVMPGETPTLLRVDFQGVAPLIPPVPAPPVEAPVAESASASPSKAVAVGGGLAAAKALAAIPADPWATAVVTARSATADMADATDAERLARCVERDVDYIDLDGAVEAERIVASMTTPVEWMRPSALAPTVTLGATVDAATFRPGTLPVPGVYAALAALAERPALVRAALGARTGTCVAVNMTRDGKKSQVLVDDWVLVNSNSLPLSPAQAHVDAALGELWPAILEKACVKSRGGYAMAADADPIQLLADIAAFPATHQDDGLDAAREDHSKVPGQCSAIIEQVQAGHLVIVRVGGMWITAVGGAATADGAGYFLKVRTTSVADGAVACALPAAYWAEHPDAAAACGAPDAAVDTAARVAWIDLVAAVASGAVERVGVCLCGSNAERSATAEL